MEGDTKFSDYLRRLNDDDKGALALEITGAMDNDRRVQLARELCEHTGYTVAPVSDR